MGDTEIIALLGIVGTLIGSFGGIGLGYLIEKSRRRYQDLTRFHEERLPSYAKFLDAATSLSIASKHKSIDAEAAKWKMAVALVHIQLFSSPPVRAAADKLSGEALKAARGEEGDTGEKDWTRKKEAFLHVAREELNIT